MNYFLYVLCELAIIACDLAEVIGSAIALNLLLNIPLPWGVAITALDVFIILFIYKEDDMKSARILESLVMMLVGVVGVCFVLELVYANPDSVDVLKGYLPSSGIFTDGTQLYIAGARTHTHRKDNYFYSLFMIKELFKNLFTSHFIFKSKKYQSWEPQ